MTEIRWERDFEYKKTHKASALRRTYDTLTENYPQSEWARRGQPYSEIPK